MLLCDRFGWTPNELDEQPAHTIQLFLDMMHLEDEQAKKKNKAKNPTKNKFRPSYGGSRKN
jgi:hypothetical protein